MTNITETQPAVGGHPPVPGAQVHLGFRGLPWASWHLPSLDPPHEAILGAVNEEHMLGASQWIVGGWAA